MGNKVSIRYEHTLSIVDYISKEKTLDIIETAIRSVTWAHIHDTSSKISMGKPYLKIDFESYSIIRVHSNSGEHWDISFKDEAAMKAFSKRISIDMLRATGGEIPLYANKTGILKNPYKAKTKKSVSFISEDPI